jgi:class 3 adenylate cyclase
VDDGPARTCEECGAPVSATAKFCAECGTPLATRAPVAEVRKTVTALFCDVTGSTALGSRLDPEALRHLMEDWFTRSSAVLARHGGTVEKFVGDAVMAVFGVPVAHEDDAVRACRAAVEILAAARELDAEVTAEHGSSFAVRIGVETGEVLVGDPSRGSTFASGTAVNTAARLEQAAGPGECLVGPGCHHLVAGLVAVEPRTGLVLKGLDGGLDAWLLHDVLDPTEVTRPLVGRLVGRDRELGLLQQAFDRAVADRTCHLVTVLGVAGMGKSRLAQELVDAVGDRALVLRGRCLSYGDAVTWWPLVEIVRAAAGLLGAESELESRRRLRALLPDAADAGQVVERIAAAAGLGGTPGPAEDTAWAVRRLLQELAHQRPVVLVVDDLHWAEAGMLAVVDDVVEWLRDAPVLVLVLARPELLDDHPTWAGGRINAVTALLEPLGAEEVTRLAADLLGDRLPAATAAKVRELAGGNPLFLEHLAGMLRDEPGATADEVQVPPTIAALLGARLDRLPAGERAVLGAASVVGQVFYRGAASELGADEDLRGHLSALMRKGLVRPVDSDIPGQEAMAFTHLLVRESAYGALPKGVRADLHERFARWLDKSTEGSAYDDLVGAHLEASYLARADLGRLDDRARDLGAEAAARLLAAARRLVGADDIMAEALLQRAVRLRDDESPDAWDLRMELVRMHLSHTTGVAQVIAEAEAVERAATAAGDERWSLHARLAGEMVRQGIVGASETRELEQLALSALETFRARGDELGMFMAESALALVAGMRLQARLMMQHNRQAADHVEAAGYPIYAQTLRLTTHWGYMSGAITAGEGLDRTIHELSAASSRVMRGQCLLGVAFFAGLLGRTEQSEAAWAEGDALVEEIGGDYPHYQRYGRGRFAMYTGDWAAAAEIFAQTAARFEAAGELGIVSTELGYLAQAQLHVGRVQEAAASAERARELGAHDDAITTGVAGAAQAWLAGLRGDREQLAARAAEALSALPEETLAELFLAHLAVAEGLLAVGDEAGATDHRRAALAATERHENVVGAALVRRLLDASR